VPQDIAQIITFKKESNTWVSI